MSGGSPDDSKASGSPDDSKASGSPDDSKASGSNDDAKIRNNDITGGTDRGSADKRFCLDTAARAVDIAEYKVPGIKLFVIDRDDPEYKINRHRNSLDIMFLESYRESIRKIIWILAPPLPKELEDNEKKILKILRSANQRITAFISYTHKSEELSKSFWNDSKIIFKYDILEFMLDDMFVNEILRNFIDTHLGIYPAGMELYENKLYYVKFRRNLVFADDSPLAKDRKVENNNLGKRDFINGCSYCGRMFGMPGSAVAAGYNAHDPWCYVYKCICKIGIYYEINNNMEFLARAAPLIYKMFIKFDIDFLELFPESIMYAKRNVINLVVHLCNVKDSMFIPSEKDYPVGLMTRLAEFYDLIVEIETRGEDWYRDRCVSTDLFLQRSL